MSDVEVSVGGLFKAFESTRAVAGVSFEVRRGEMFGIIGPDGAGKTTTLRCVLGLLRPDAGRVHTCGREPVRERRALSREVGYLAQRFSLYGDLSVDENIAFFAQVHGVKGWRSRRDELLEMLRMTPFRGRLADRLSGGMKQKLALACTLIHTPRLLVLDEPTTGVDPVSRRDFWKILSGLRRSGMTVLVTTPYLDEAERCERVALVDHGRVLVLDRPDALRASLGATLVEIIARPVREARRIVVGAPGVHDAQLFGERIHVTLTAGSDAAGVEVATTLRERLQDAGIEVEALRSITPSLEDVFIARLREAESKDKEVA